MSAATAASPPRGGPVQKVRSIFKELVDQENAAATAAREEYPRLLELEDADPKHIDRLREVMRLLGKSPADITADLAKIQEGRRLQGVIRHGSGLDAQREAAAKALADHIAESARIAEERRRQQFALLQTETELGGRYFNAGKARNDLSGLKAQHGDVLRYVELPELT